MAKRVERQELIDIDGFREAIADARADYKAFADDVTRLNATLRSSIAGLESEIQKTKTLNGQTGDTRIQEQYYQLVTKLSPVLQDQRAASAALTAQQQQLEKVTSALLSRQEELIKQIAGIEGSTGREIQLRKRLTSELVANQTQLDKLARSSKLAADGARAVDGQYNKLQQELTNARTQLKSLNNAFDENTGAVNKNNSEAVRLSGIILKNDAILRRYDETFKLHSRNIGNYPQTASGVVGSLTAMATGYLTLDAAFGAVSHIVTSTKELQGYETALTQALGSQQAALESLEMIRQFTDKNRAINTDELTQGFIKLTQRGFVPTQQELTKLVDLALSTNKTFDQLAEAILDAQTGEFERLKEFGVTASKAGDQITFAFKGQSTTVKATGAEIQKYLLSLGDIKGVAGSAALASKNLTGDINELGNVAESVFTRVGTRLAPLISLVVSGATATLRAVRNLLKSAVEESKDSLRVYEDQRDAVKSLNDDIEPLLKRYDELTAKAKQVGGVTNLSKKEQNELRNAIDKVSGVIPSAITAQNQYGKVMAINTGLARDYITEQERVAKVLNADSINKYNESLKLTQQRMQGLQKQLVTLQGATPTPNGGPAVSSPTNTGQSTGFKPTGLTEAQRVSEIARIKTELEKANDEAKNLTATIDYLSGKAPKPKSAIPASTPSNTIIGSGGKGKDPQKEADERLRNALATIRKETEVTASALDAAYESGAVKEVDYLDQRLTILQDGILKEQDLLRSAGKTQSDDYKETQTRLNEVAADYLSKRNKLEDEAVKRSIDAVKALIDSDTGELKTKLANRVSDLQVAYNDEATKIRALVARRQLSESEGELRLYDLKIKLLQDIADATAENATEVNRITTERLTKLENELRIAGKSEIDIQKALEAERKKLLDERTESEKKAAEDRAKINDEEAQKKKKLLEDEAEVRKRTEETYREAALAAVSGYFELTASFRERDLARLDKDKQRELELAGDNADAKASIEQKYDAKSRELRRKQAIADKAQAAFNIALSTTESIMKTFAQFGFVIGGPLAIAMGVLGAINLAAVLSRPIPEYFKGSSDVPESGPAWVGERGYELIESNKNGKPEYRFAAQKQIMYLNKHDRVYTHSQTKNLIQKNREIASEVRTAPGGSMYLPQPVYSGPSANDLTNSFIAAVATLPIEENHWDEKGYRRVTRRGNQRTEWLNKYVNLDKRKN